MGEIQAYLFDKKKYTAKEARKWMKKFKYEPIKKVHITDNYLRYRVRDPKKYKRFITRDFGKGIKYIIGFEN